MQGFVVIAAATGLALAASGCVIHVGPDEDSGYRSQHRIEKQEVRNRDAIGRMALGTSVSAAMDQLGEPDYSDLTTVDGKELRILRYRTNRVHADGDTSRDETTPLVFVDGKLVGTGEIAAVKALGN